MTQPNTVRVQINATNLLETFRYAFTSKETVLKELLQNGRRAGATRIEVAYDEKTKTLEVADNGCGVDDMQKMLFIAESGWGEDIKAGERPFGCGFLSCLYSGHEVEVESNGYRLSFDTSKALALRDLAVEKTPTLPGTRVRLRGFDLDRSRYHPSVTMATIVGDAMERLVKGFPIPVSFNDKELERPHALDSGLTFVPASIGMMHLDAVHDRDANPSSGGTDDCALYLQGFRVNRRGGANIVHLDSAIFLARAPDRDCLHNEEEQIARIANAVRDYWRDVLRRAIEPLPPETIAKDFYRALKKWGLLTVLNDNPHLPKWACMVPDELPYITGDGEGFVTHTDLPVTRADIESGKYRLVCIPNDFQFLAWPALYEHKNIIALDETALDPGHWAHAVATPLVDTEITVEIHKARKVERLNGNYGPYDVLPCSHAVLKTKIGDLPIRENAFFTGEDYTDIAVRSGVRHLKDKLVQTILLPDNAEATKYPLRQVNSFTDSDGFAIESDIDAEWELFEGFALALAKEPPAKLIERLLHKANLDTVPSARGKKFTLRISHSGKFHVKQA